MGLGMRAGLRYRALGGRADGLGVFPDRAGLVVVGAGLPGLAALLQLGLGQAHIERALVGVDVDDVAVLDQADRAADRRLRPDMADAEAAGTAGEPAVGDQRHGLAPTLAVDRRGGGEHLTHAGTAARP